MLTIIIILIISVMLYKKFIWTKPTWPGEAPTVIMLIP